jgi:NADPH:quinone reductase-like Zn-dependent oxidoreductase
MRAAVLQVAPGTRGFGIQGNVDDPEVRAGEVSIRLAAASINPLDTMMREGYGESLFKWLRRRGPMILGLDGAGVVASVGAGVTRFQKGDRVMAAVMPFRSGFYADRVSVPAAWVAPVPASLPIEIAAALPYAGLTAMQVLKAARLGPDTASGKRVLVHGGAGGIGSLLVQLLHAWGAWVATTCRTSNIPLVKSLGADLAIDYTCEDFGRVLSDMDVVINTVAPKTPKIVEGPHLAVLRKGGHYVSLISPTLTLADALGAPLGLMVSGLWMGIAHLRWLIAGKNHHWVYFKPSGANLAKFGEWVAAGWVQPLIGGMYPLTDVAIAQQRAENGPVQGKLLLALDESLLNGSTRGASQGSTQTGSRAA